MKPLFPNASQSFKARNPHLFVGAMDQPQRKPHVRGPRKDKALEGSSGGVAYRVSLVSFRTETLDGDNLSWGFKPLRDIIAETLGVDDAERFIEWEYRQVITTGETGTCVIIQPLTG